MGILGIENRTENWKTAYCFSPFFRDPSARSILANRLLKPLDKSQSSDVHLELFWYGMRDYIAHLKKEKKPAPTPQDLAERYTCLFGDLRGHIEKFIEEFGQSRTLRPLNNTWNYDVGTEDSVKSLYSNLARTEIDIVLETSKHLFIGEAKHESKLVGDGSRVLVHQFIREYVMATILVDFRASDDYPRKIVIPFVVGDDAKQLKEYHQIRFMISQERKDHDSGKKWLDEKNVLSWDDIENFTRNPSAKAETEQ